MTDAREAALKAAAFAYTSHEGGGREAFGSAFDAMLGAIVEPLSHCRDIAMRMMMEARIPECGQFGAIAQELDALIGDLGNGK